MSLFGPNEKGRKVFRIWKTTVWTLLVAIFLVIICAIVGNLGPREDYANAVGGHLENAKTSSTPELMKQEIDAALTGTYELGLEDDDHGAWLKWFKTPERSVKYQRERLENITIRLDEVIEWRESDAYSQEMQDVYNRKFENIKDLRSEEGDRKIKYAWYVKEHLLLYLTPEVLVFLTIALAVCGFAFMPLDFKYDMT